MDVIQNNSGFKGKTFLANDVIAGMGDKLYQVFNICILWDNMSHDYAPSVCERYILTFTLMVFIDGFRVNVKRYVTGRQTWSF